MNKFSKAIAQLHRTFCLAAVLSLLAAAPLHAAEKQLHYLTAGAPKAATLLPPPAPLDSSEQAAEMEEVRIVYHSAGSNDLAAAYSEKKFSVFNFTPAVGAFFTVTNLPRTAAFFEKVQQDAAIVTDAGKEYFHRPRPFATDPTLANGKLEKSFGYPSGHSTESMVLALVLAGLLPENREPILAQARSIGWHRVQIARHYPSDIHAGRVLAQAITKQLKLSESFKKDLAEVKAEIDAARK